MKRYRRRVRQSRFEGCSEIEVQIDRLRGPYGGVQGGAKRHRRETGDLAGPDGLGPKFFPRRSAERYVIDFQDALVVQRNAVTVVPEGNAERVQFGDDGVAGGAGRFVAPGKDGKR